MATWKQLMERLLPDEVEEVREFILWNHTAFPADTVLGVARSVKHWKELAKDGLSECVFCGKEYISGDGKVVLGGECGEHFVATPNSFVVDAK